MVRIASLSLLCFALAACAGSSSSSPATLASAGDAGAPAPGLGEFEQRLHIPWNVTVGESASQVIGSAGGTVQSPNGQATLKFPPGALANDQTIRITELHHTRDDGSDAVAYHCEPDGLTFPDDLEHRPVVEYQLGAFEHPEAYLATFFDEQGQEVIYDTWVDEQTQVLSAYLPHFSVHLPDKVGCETFVGATHASSPREDE